MALSPAPPPKKKSVAVLQFEELTRKLHFANTSRQCLMKSMDSGKRAKDSCLSTCDSMRSNQLVFVSPDSWGARDPIWGVSCHSSWGRVPSLNPCPGAHTAWAKCGEGKGDFPEEASHPQTHHSVDTNINPDKFNSLERLIYFLFVSNRLFQ